MAELLEWLNAGDLSTPLYVRAAMAHLNLVSIHPWRDGNGRMSRCLHTLLLARDGVLAPEFSSIEEWIGTSTANTGRYYNALQTTRATWDPDADAHDWVRFCCGPTICKRSASGSSSPPERGYGAISPPSRGATRSTSA